MDFLDRAVSALLTFMGVFFALAIGWALTEAFTGWRFSVLGSRTAFLWVLLAIGVGAAVLRSSRRPRATASPIADDASVLPPPRKRVISAASVDAPARTPSSARASAREAIDMAEAADVAWVKAQRDPALWHEAVMATLAYRGDPHGFLPWVLTRPELDRATAGWIFLWAEGSRYLRGSIDFPLNTISSAAMVELFTRLCERSERAGFDTDHIGLDPDFDAERRAALAIVESGGVQPGIVAPMAIIAKPFGPARPDPRYTLDDGIILL